MSALARIKKTVAQHEHDRQYDKALALYARLLDGSEAGGEELDVGLYNRAGDLALRAGDAPRAIGYFEKALDLYAAGGFLNNAIALGVKILRHAPTHLSAHYTLGVLYGRKGFASDARHHLLTYAVQMQRAGRHDEAGRVVREVADACHDDGARRAALDAYGAMGGDATLASVLGTGAARTASTDDQAGARADRAPGAADRRASSALELLDLSAGASFATAASAPADAPPAATAADAGWAAALPGEPPALRLGDLADVVPTRAGAELPGLLASGHYDDLFVVEPDQHPTDATSALPIIIVDDVLPVEPVDVDLGIDPFTLDLDTAPADPALPAADMAPASAGLDFLEVPADDWAPAPVALWTPDAPAEAAPAAPPAATHAVSDDGLDLGAWLRDVTPEESTRMTTSVVPQSGDEQADFDATLRAFTAGVSRAVDHEDFDSHYDLGVAFREMGLLEEAIVEFQRAARAPSGALRAHEALAQCFLDGDQPELAFSTLAGPAAMAAREGTGDASLIAVHYLLGAAAQALGRGDEARGWFVRVVATDVRFRDAGQRLAALSASPSAPRSSPLVPSPI